MPDLIPFERGSLVSLPNTGLELKQITIPHFSRIDDWTGIWLMEPNAAHALQRLVAATNWPEHMAAAPPKPETNIRYESGRGGKNIAVIRMAGTLMKSQSSFGGGTSTVQVRRDIRAAVADGDVSGILLSIDSPGGTVAGTAALGREVQEAGKIKPVYAHIEDMGASAAYWVASQAHKVFADAQTTQVGSIGTYLTLYDYSAVAEREGVKVHHFATGPLKGLGADGVPITNEQASYLQGQVEKMQAEFDSAVRMGRNMSRNQLADVRTGGTFLANEAEKKGLIDGVKTLDQTIKALASAKLS